MIPVTKEIQNYPWISEHFLIQRVSKKSHTRLTRVEELLEELTLKVLIINCCNNKTDNNSNRKDKVWHKKSMSILGEMGQ